MSSDSVAVFYDHIRARHLARLADQWGSLVTCSQYRLAYRKTLQYVRAGSLCLDWGAGNGHFSFFLVQSGYPTEAFAFDKPPDFLADAPIYHYTKGNMADPFALPYEANHFEAVFSMGVLEHVHEFGGDQIRSLHEIERILKPGGLFLIFHLPNRYSWIESLVRLLNRWTGANKHAHSKLFTRESFDELISGTRFETLEAGRYNMIPRNSFNHMPGVLANNRWFCRLVDMVDDVLVGMLPGLAQNWFFILRKKAQA